MNILSTWITSGGQGLKRRCFHVGAACSDNILKLKLKWFQDASEFLLRRFCWPETPIFRLTLVDLSTHSDAYMHSLSISFAINRVRPYPEFATPIKSFPSSSFLSSLSSFHLFSPAIFSYSGTRNEGGNLHF